MKIKGTNRIPDKPGHWIRLKKDQYLLYVVRYVAKQRELTLYWGWEGDVEQCPVKKLKQEEGVKWFGPMELE